MDEAAKRLFVGIKITRAIQDDLDNPAPDVKQYFDASNDYLQIVEFGAAKFIGRYLDDGFPGHQSWRYQPQRLQHRQADYPRQAHRRK